MAYFSICSVLVDTDIVPSSYQPFLVSDGHICSNADLIIRRVRKPYPTKGLYKVAESSDLIIWKDTLYGNNYNWVFEARNGMFTIAVDKNYTNASFYSLDILNSLGFEQDSILGIYLKIIIECKLVQREYTVLHSACVELDGVAYAFTGPSGIGKSTRAGKWCELMGADWISGDRPAINVRTGNVYGVPWDGKEKIYRNVNCPLIAIMKVKRSTETKIYPLQIEEKVQLLCEQTFIPMWDTDLATKALLLLKKLIRRIPIFELSCDITDESSNIAYGSVKAYLEEIGGHK